MSFKITPESFLIEVGAQFQKRDKWLSFRFCPFCNGGHSGDKFSFSVHIVDGNFFCHRAKCGAKGSFWKLIELFNRNPREYRDVQGFIPKKKKKRFIYGK